MENYDIFKDESFLTAISVNEIAEQTFKTYGQATKIFCEANNKPFYELVKNMKDGEFGEIIGNKIKPYDVEESLTKEYLLNFKNYMEKIKQVSPTTVKLRLSHIRIILKNLNIILPKPFKIKNKKRKVYLLTRSDIQYIMSISNIHHQAILAFGGCTGLRVSDIFRLTIGDFMLATQKYHNATSVEEFIAKAPNDMIGYWELIPQKTQSTGLECKVCNTPESCNLILESLRQRVESIKMMNAKRGKNEKLEFNDALFSSNNKYYKGFLNTGSFGVTLYHKNKLLQDKLHRELEFKLKNKEISLMEYKKKLEEFPKLHPHALRHYFISVLNAYCSNKTIALMMEAHVSDVKTHKHYIGQSEELYDEDMIREHYNQLIPYLTFNYKIDYTEYVKMNKLIDEFNNLLSKENILEYVD